MPVWSFAIKSVQAFFNFSFGQYFSQPLREDQVIVTKKGIGCKDVYFNIERLNAIVAERGIPIVLCVAYVAEIIVCLPWSVEIHGIDIVIQAVSGRCSPAENDDLLNSMISSMTAAAFAAAKVVHGVDHWPNIDAEVESTASEAKGGGLWSWVQNLFEKMTTTLEEEVNFENEDQNSLVDYESKKRLALMLDSLIAQTTVILRDVTIRIECQLGLPNMDRASSLTLCFGELLLTNQQSTTADSNATVRQAGKAGAAEAKPECSSPTPGGQSKDDPSDCWSWFRWWRRKPADPLVTASTGSLFTMMHKIVRLDSANIFWDLWDTSQAGQSDQSAGRQSPSTLPPSELDYAEAAYSKLPAYGPTTENIVASGKLVSLSGCDNTARISMCCPLLSALTSSQQGSATVVAPVARPGDLASFQLRVYLDLGPLVACACPSQFYWLRLMLGQLVRISEVYADQLRLREGRSLGRQAVSPPAGPWQPGYESPNCLRQTYRRPHPSESDLVDLDLSSLPHQDVARSGANVSMMDSKLFWSCVTDDPLPREMTFVDMESSTAITDTMIQGYPVHQETKTKSHFSLAANVLSAALIVFYEDESLSPSAASSPTQEAPGATGTNGQLTELSQLAGGVNSSSMLRSVIGPPSAGRSRERCESPSTTSDHQSEGGQEEETSESPATELPTNGSATSIGIAALPGPSLFFARCHGFLPWKQQVLLPPAGDQVTKGPPLDEENSVFTARPMRIDRQEVDTGRMNPAAWVAHLRRQFAQLAAPRDHICLVGGLWRVEMCSRSVASTRTSAEYQVTLGQGRGLPRQGHTHGGGGGEGSGAGGQTVVNLSQLDINAQLFGVELSECLFEDSKEQGEVTAENSQPVFVQLLTFPDRLRTGSDRHVRSPGDPAIELSLLFHLSPTSTPATSSSRDSETVNGSRPVRGSNRVETPTPPCDRYRLDLAFCRLEVDVSLSDRLHRVVDALAAAGEAVVKWMPVSVSPSASSNASSPTRSKVVAGGFDERDEFGEFRGGLTNWPTPRANHFISTPKAMLTNPLQMNRCPTSRELRTNSDLQVECSSCELVLRFPVPLEAMKLEPSQKLSDLRCKLWSSGTPFWLDPDQATDPQGGAFQGLAWWRRTLRPEYLRICLDMVKFSHHQMTVMGREGVGLAAGQPVTTATSFRLPSHKAGGGDGKLYPTGLADDEESVKETIELSLHCVSVWLCESDGTRYQHPEPFLRLSGDGRSSDPITLSLSVAQPGRQELIERSDGPPGGLADYYADQPVAATTGQRECFEVGVDLARAQEAVVTSQAAADVEWVLWKRMGPKQNRRTPLVVRRNFLQDAIKAHSKQTTYYPGDSNHMQFYRRWASSHTWLSLKCRMPVASVNVTSKRLVDVLYFRVLYDLLLWSSLLPNDRRLRATLARYRGRQSSTELGEIPRAVTVTMTAGDSRRMDHCYWFLSDPAPLASIYAHPEAAREAARLEASSVRYGGDLLYNAGQYPGGLHFLPMESDDDEGEMEVTANEGGGGRRDSRSTAAFIYDGPSRGAARYGNDTSSRRSRSNSVNEEDQLDETVAQTSTAVQRQSLVCVHVDVGQLEACVTLPPAATAGSGQVDDFVRLSASRADFFVELGHNGEAEVNYATAEVTGCNVFFTANHLRPGVQHQSTANDQAGQVWWPGLVDISSNPLGFPAKSSAYGAYEEDVTSSGVGSSGSSSSPAGPVLSLALEHRHSRHVNSSGSNTSGYLDDFVLALRLQNACLVHWPSLDADVCGSCAASGSSGMPLWLSRLLQVLETPSVDRLSQVLPAYVMPDILLIQHIHLERVAFVWSHRESLAVLGGQTATPSVSSEAKRQVRGLLTVESISLTLNSVSETVPGGGGTGNVSAAVDLINPMHGMLIMAFLSNSAVFLCPVPRGLLPSVSDTPPPGSSATTLPSALFSRWLQSLDLSECVCVVDLDHLEARFFFDTMKVPTKKLESALVSRVDMRATNNLLRMSTCADSLAVLLCLTESLYSSPFRCAACQAVGSRLASKDDDFLWLDDSRKALLGKAENSVEDLLKNAISDVNTTPDERHRNSSSVSSGDSASWRSLPRRSKQPHVKTLYPTIKSEEKDSRSREDASPTSSEEFVMVSPSDCVPRSSLGECADRVRVLATDAGAYSISEDFYALPNAFPDRQSVGGGEARRRGHSSRHMFVDPPAIYPRANVGVTLYNFSLEWNLYGGHDLALSGCPALPGDRSFSPSPTSTMSGASAVSDARPSLGKQAKGTDSPSSRADVAFSIPTRVPSGYRFRHDRSSANCLSGHVSLNTGKSRGRAQAPATGSAPTIAYLGRSPSENSPGELLITTSLRSLYNRGGKNRDVQKAISICLANIYFRHATFPPGAGPRKDRQPGEATWSTGRGTGADSRDQPASRHVLSIGSVVVLDQVAASNINQLLYTYIPPVSGCHVLHNSRTPVFRAAVVCHRVDTLGDRLPGAVKAAPSDRPSLELEAQVSIQPLRINLDQNTLSFLGEFQQSFANHCSLLFLPLACESGQGSQASVGAHGCHGDQQLPLVDDAGSIFIRKVTFYPDLPIRLDYHGRKLDLSTGSLHGILQMLLQINNGELVIPRRVYQRGYPTVDKLLEEIMDDLRSTVKSQLAQMLVTSIGPMHEVSQFILGLWDLIYQPIQSVYQSTRLPTIPGMFMSPANSQVDLSVRERRTSGSSSSGTGGTTAFMHGLKRGTRSFSACTLWAALQLSIQGVRAVQSVAETAYDLVTPGPALRSRQLRLRQPADLREGFSNAVTAMSRGLRMVTEDLCGATRLAEVDVGYGANKGPVGIVGDVLRQVPPTIVAPMVTGCEVTGNILGGFRNQLHPEAKLEDEQKWKDTHGL